MAVRTSALLPTLLLEMGLPELVLFPSPAALLLLDTSQSKHSVVHAFENVAPQRLITQANRSPRVLRPAWIHGA